VGGCNADAWAVRAYMLRHATCQFAALGRLCAASLALDNSPADVQVRLSADKGHTCERSRNPDGSLSGADRSTAADADLWDADDVFRWALVRSCRGHAREVPPHVKALDPAGTAAWCYDGARGDSCNMHLQADGLQRGLRLCARHQGTAHAPHQYDTQAALAHLAGVLAAAEEVGWHGQ
jgi:hypothetical protein